MLVEFSTICSDDHFQHYIAPYVYCLQTSSHRHRITIVVNGKVDSITEEALKAFDNRVNIIPLIDKIPVGPSTINCSRFIHPIIPSPFKPDADYILITDIDLLLFEAKTLVDCRVWGLTYDTTKFYFTHHGPEKHPVRFSGGWKGDKERLAGGFVLLKPEWFKLTEKIRERHYKELMEGKLGTLYREEDEVLLCNMVKEVGLPVCSNKYFDPNLRGIHLGDFKDSMTHRWTNVKKMAKLMTDNTVLKYSDMNKTDKTWQKIKDISCEDPIIKQVFDNLDKYIKGRLCEME